MPTPGSATRGVTTSADTATDRLAAAAAALAPVTVSLVGDDGSLADALRDRGVTLVDGDAAVAPHVGLTIIRVRSESVEEVLTKLPAPGGEVLLWADGDADVAAWAVSAAAAGHVRAANDVQVRSLTCLLLDATQPAVPDLVARYEALLSANDAALKQLVQLRHDVLTGRDHAIGAEAEIAQQRAANQALHRQLNELYETTTWRVGSRLIGPLGRVKRILGR